MVTLRESWLLSHKGYGAPFCISSWKLETELVQQHRNSRGYLHPLAVAHAYPGQKLLCPRCEVELFKNISSKSDWNQLQLWYPWKCFGCCFDGSLLRSLNCTPSLGCHIWFVFVWQIHGLIIPKCPCSSLSTTSSITHNIQVFRCWTFSSQHLFKNLWSVTEYNQMWCKELWNSWAHHCQRWAQ